MSLFIYRSGADTVYLMLYVDDIVMKASSSALLRRVFAALQGEFSMKDQGALHRFLGLSVTCSGRGLFLLQ